MRNRRLSSLFCLLLMASLILSGCSDKNKPLDPSKTASMPLPSETSVKSETKAQRYQQALDLFADARFHEAALIFQDIADFRQSQELAAEARQRMILAPVEIDGRWGYIDRFGNKVIEPQYENAKPFRDGKALVQNDSGWSLIDPEGNTLQKIDGAWTDVGPFSCGLASFATLNHEGENRYGAIDYHGRVVYEAHSQIPIYFIGNTALVVLDGIHFYMDISGKLHPRAYFMRDSAPGFENSLHPTLLYMTYYGIYAESGLVEDFDLSNYGKGYQGTGYAYPDGTLAIPFQFDQAGEFSQGLAAVRDFSARYGYIDRQGEYVLEPIYDFAGEFSQGLAVVKINGLYGYINPAGDMIIAPQFAEAKTFQEGLAAVRSVDAPEYAGWGFIDPSGDYVLDPQFGHVIDGFMAGFCAVAEPLDEATWNDFLNTDEYGFIASVYNYGFIDPQGIWQVPPQHDFINRIEPGFYFAEARPHSLEDRSFSSVQTDFTTNHGERQVLYTYADGSTQVRYFGREGYIDQLTPYDETIRLERSGRQVNLWDLLWQGDMDLSDLPPDMSEFYHGLIAFGDQGRYGFKDEQGDVILPATYQNVGPFGNCNDPLLLDLIAEAAEDLATDDAEGAMPNIKEPQAPSQYDSEFVKVVRGKLGGNEILWLSEVHVSGGGYILCLDYFTQDDYFIAAADMDMPFADWQIETSETLEGELEILSMESFASFHAGQATDQKLLEPDQYTREAMWHLFQEFVSD